MDKELEFTRKDLLALLDDLGVADNAAHAADDAMLEAVVRNRLQLVVDVAKIDRLLAKSLPIEWRAKLMARRGELENAARAVREAVTGRQPATGGLEVVVPPDVGISHLIGIGGRVCCSRLKDDGRLVFDLFPHELRSLLGDKKHGLLWERSNSEAIRQLGQMR
jgi:hypothetical protein